MAGKIEIFTEKGHSENWSKKIETFLDTNFLIPPNPWLSLRPWLLQTKNYKLRRNQHCPLHLTRAKELNQAGDLAPRSSSSMLGKLLKAPYENICENILNSQHHCSLRYKSQWWNKQIGLVSCKWNLLIWLIDQFSTWQQNTRNLNKSLLSLLKGIQCNIVMILIVQLID